MKADQHHERSRQDEDGCDAPALRRSVQARGGRAGAERRASQEGAISPREYIPNDYRCRATRSGFWLAYAAAFPQRTHRFCGKEEGETNHAERWFGTVRSRLSRLVRRTYSFSKSVERHLETIHLFIATYNLRIQQQSMVS